MELVISQPDAGDQKSALRARSDGAAVKCTSSILAAWGSPAQISGVDMAPLGMPCCGRCPTYKVEEDGPGFLSKKEEDWQQLAQG